MEKETDKADFLRGRIFELKALDALEGQVRDRIAEIEREEKDKEELEKQYA